MKPSHPLLLIADMYCTITMPIMLFISNTLHLYWNKNKLSLKILKQNQKAEYSTDEIKKKINALQDKKQLMLD